MIQLLHTYPLYANHIYGHEFLTWPWPWPWPSKVKCSIGYNILVENGPIATKWKRNISIEHWASNVAIDFDLGHDLDLFFIMCLTSHMLGMGGPIATEC